MPIARLATVSILATFVCACTPDAPASAAKAAVGEWRAYGADKAGTKYSPLDEINRDTIGNLRIAWRRSAMPEELRADFPNTDGPRNLQHTPLMVDGLLYMSSVVGAVVALDPTTGNTVWYDHLPPRADGNGLTRGGSTRSLAYWSDGTDARIVTNVGSSLVALNAKTGERYSDFGDGGQVDLTQGFERPVTGWRWTSGPVVVRDVIVVAGVPAPATDILSEAQLAPKEMPPDDVRGYDVRTGKQLWTFHVVPRAGEPGNETWLESSWTYSGNSGSWTLLGADEELGYVYLPTEEATGDYYGGTRPGDNLYAESIVALDAATGKRVWHFQTLHHGIWDYDLPAPPVLADITVDGRPIKAIAQVSKQAFVFVLNRETGEPVWPIEERPAPQGNVPGERYSPTQPFPTKPPAFDQQGVTEADVIDFTPELKAEAMAILEGYAYGPLYTPPVLLGNPETPKGTLLVPGTNGGADWGGAALDPETNILYVPSAHMPTVIALGPSTIPESTLPYVKHRVPWPFGPRGLPDPFKPPYSRLVAIDLNEGTIRWSVANGEGLSHHPAFAGLDLPPLGAPGRLAALVTKSFVFMGEGSDTGVGLPPGGGYGGKMFRAFDKATGEIVWEMELPAGVSNAPMTYSAGGKQYIVVGISGSEHGVIAIIITIMVLELRAPHGEDLATLAPLWPVFLSYVLSFLYVGIYWNNHHHMLHACTRVNGATLWANLHLLFWLSLFPFVTGWMGENHFAPTPSAVYGIVLLLAAIAYWILQRTIIAADGPDSKLGEAVGRDWKGTLSLLFYVVAIASTFGVKWVAQAIYVAVALIWLIPDRRIEHRLEHER